MKSKSPFSKKSPIRVQTYGGDTYESPDTVITKTVGEQVGKAITGIANNAVDYMNVKGKLAKGKSDHIKAMELANIKYGKKTSGKTSLGLTTPSEVGSNLPKVPGVPDLVSQSKTFSAIKGETFKDQDAWDSNRNNVQNDPRFKGKGGKDKFFTAAKLYREDKGTGVNTTFDKGKTRFEDGKRMLAINMNGSPNKIIGDTMDPYEQINPGAVPPNQAQNDLGAQPIIEAQGSQPSARAIDMAAIGNPYATPGADFNPQSKMKAESMFGSTTQRQALMNLGTPLHDKGHADDYEGHTHRKIGGSYKEGDYMDETDMETSYPKLYTQDVGEIKRDKKSQFMVSKNEDYNPTKIDTIRPSKGKEFKMTWGDAERNISTNPKYKKSN